MEYPMLWAMPALISLVEVCYKYHVFIAIRIDTNHELFINIPTALEIYMNVVRISSL